MAVPFALFFLMLSREEEPDDPMFAVVFGLALGFVFALTAVSERLLACRRLVMVHLTGRLVSGRFLPLCQIGLLLWV
ncbi:hypothetical protein ACFVRD_48390, partial [Streptomyces sp. NPDC057908]